MNVRDILINALQSLGYEVSLQGSYADAEPLPESFITYQIVTSNDQSFYDNNPKISNYTVQVVFYSKKMSLIKTVPDLIYSGLKNAGFTRQGKGRDIPFNTDYYGWMVEYFYTERND